MKNKEEMKGVFAVRFKKGHISKKKVIAVLLAGVLAVSVLTPAMAADQAAVQTYADEEESDYYTEIEDAAEYVQTQLLARAETIVVNYATTDTSKDAWLEAINDIFDAAVAGISIESTNYTCSYSGYYDTIDGTKVCYLTFKYTVTYSDDLPDITYYTEEEDVIEALTEQLEDEASEITIGYVSSEEDTASVTADIKEWYSTAAESLTGISTTYTLKTSTYARTQSDLETLYYRVFTFTVTYAQASVPDIVYYTDEDEAAEYLSEQLQAGEETIVLGYLFEDSDSDDWLSDIKEIYDTAAESLDGVDTEYTVSYSSYLRYDDEDESVYYLVFTFTVTYTESESDYDPDDDDTTYYASVEEAAAYLRTQLLLREEEIELGYQTTDSDADSWKEAMSSIYTQASDGIYIGTTEYEAGYSGYYLTSDSGEKTYYLTIEYSVEYDEEELSDDVTYYESESKASADLLSQLNEWEEEIVIGFATTESDPDEWEELIKSIYETAAKSLSDDVAESTSYTAEYTSIARTDETGVTTYYLEITYSVVYDGESSEDFTYYESTEEAASYMAAQLLSGETTIEVGLATTESDSAVWKSYIDTIYSAAAANLTLGNTTYTAVYSGYYETDDSGETIYYLTFTYTINYAETAEINDDEDDDDWDDDDDSVSLKNQTIKVKTKTTKKTFKVKKLASKKRTFEVKATGKGKITFKKTGGSSCLKINKKGKVTVKKGTAKGTYMISVKVRAAGNATYKAAEKSIIIKVKVK